MGRKSKRQRVQQINFSRLDCVAGRIVGLAEVVGAEVEWTEVEHDSDDDDEEEEEDETDFIAIRADLIHRVFKSNMNWRQKGSNSNVRGAGTSERTHYRDKAKRIQLENASSQSKSLRDMWRVPSVVDEVEGAEVALGDDGFDMLLCHPCEITSTKQQSLSYIDAIALLLESENRYVSKSISKQNSLTEFDRRRRLAVCRYLQLVVDGDCDGKEYSKMSASQHTAFMLFGKKDLHSYKARCIRQWAEEFCLNKELSIYKYGERTKTKSIITDEDFSLTCKEYLR